MTLSTRGKGEGSIYRTADGAWRASVELPPDPATGRRRRKYLRARTKTEVVRRMRALQTDPTALAVASSPSMRLADWLTAWLERDVAPRRKPSTAAGYRADVTNHVVPLLGSRPLDRLGPQDVRDLHAAVAAKGRSPATVSRVHRVLSVALTAAEREGLLARNPCRLVSPPPLRQAPADALTADQARTYLASRRGEPDYARRLTSFLLGARQGEVLGITLDSLHLDATTPSVELAWEVRRVTWSHGCGRPDATGTWPCTRKRGADCPTRYAPVPAHLDAERVHGGLWLLRPKTVGSWRHVALPPVLADAYRHHIDTYRPARFLFESAPGVPMDPSRDFEQWSTSLEAAGLPHVRLHSARSTAATLLLEAGVPQRLIMEILGHTQVATTARYQHPSLAFQGTALTDLAGRLTTQET